jgi:16S rRNA (uracil1498-N3)-methyltransferase
VTPPLFLVDAIGPGDGLLLDGPEGRHAATVKRLRAGEDVLVGDGRGTLARAVVASVVRDAVQLVLGERVAHPAPAPRVLLAQALVKGDRGELAVELATEAGVDGVLPWRAARCVARWEDGPRGDKALARWRSTAREAAKQARRPWVPVVEDPVGTPALARRAAGATALVLHEDAGEALAAVPLPAAGDVLLVVGPEGGITDRELAALTAAGGVPVRLGSSVVRTSTAGAAAVAVVSARTARWA